jgi:alpha-L-fucosidase
MNRRDFLATGAQAALMLSALGACRSLPAGGNALLSGRPVPTPQQLAWQRDELGLFVHFGVNTFTNREWGDGSEDPRIFNPARLDAGQWARVARDAGFRHVILTAKHHDGFCLWPTETTDHSVRSSPWRGGQGDVVREMVDACRAEGLGVGLYLSPWDQNAPAYGDTRAYNDFYARQLNELLTWYGPIVEMWFDGAKGPDAADMEYDWARIHRTVRELQPDALIFSDSGPDIRWIGNERGIAGEPNWATVDPALVPYPGIPGDHIIQALQHGQPHGDVWRPGEADVSIRPGWFWHPEQDERVRSPENLLELYFLSVGRNAGLLLNVPPTTDGLFHPTDVRHLGEWARHREALFATDLARGARAEASASAGRANAAGRVTDEDPDTFWSPPAGASTGWVEVSLPRPTTFDVVSLREAIAGGQHVDRYVVEGWNGSAWTPLSRGTTVGNRKLDRTASPVTTDRVRLTIESSLATPRISEIALYHSGA